MLLVACHLSFVRNCEIIGLYNEAAAGVQIFWLSLFSLRFKESVLPPGETKVFGHSA